MDSRRNFVKKGMLLGSVLSLSPDLVLGQSLWNANGKLNVGIIGLGNYGVATLSQLIVRKDINVVALCDLSADNISKGQKLLEKNNKKPASTFSGNEYSYLDLLAMKELDAVIIASSRKNLLSIATDAVLAGKFAGFQLPSAQHLDEGFKLVRAFEETGSQVMILDDLMHRRDMMAALNMLKNNVFGETFHFKCSYEASIHLENRGLDNYKKWLINANDSPQSFDVYPASGIAPIAVMADINRGNKFMELSSQLASSEYLNKFKKDNISFKSGKVGDVLTTVIQTSKKQSILISYEGNTRSFDSTGIKIQGNSGIWDRQMKAIKFENETNAGKWEEDKNFITEYDHPSWSDFNKLSGITEKQYSNQLVLDSFVQAAKKNLTSLIDVYDVATLSAIAPLTDASLSNNGKPQAFPDFTNGSWQTKAPNFPKFEIDSIPA